MRYCLLGVGMFLNMDGDCVWLVGLTWIGNIWEYMGIYGNILYS